MWITTPRLYGLHLTAIWHAKQYAALYNISIEPVIYSWEKQQQHQYTEKHIV